MNTKKQVALIELYGHHAENLYTQILILKSYGYRVQLICNRKTLPYLPPGLAADSVTVYRLENGFLMGLFVNFQSLLQIRRNLLKNDIQKVILQTAQGRRTLLFLLIFGKTPVQFFGIIHHTNIFCRWSQRLISIWVRDYFFMNDHQLLHLPKHRVRVRSFYTIFFPPVREKTTFSKEGNFHIAVPGAVEIKRRDYFGLISQMEENRHQIPANLRILLAGSCGGAEGTAVRRRIESAGLSPYFILFDHFLPHDTFHNLVSVSDLVLPLVHTSLAANREYLNNKMTGSFNLAVAYQIPMLLEEPFICYEDFRETSFYYPPGGLMKHLLFAMKNPAEIGKRKTAYRENPKWTFEYQQSRLRCVAGEDEQGSGSDS